LAAAEPQLRPRRTGIGTALPWVGFTAVQDRRGRPGLTYRWRDSKTSRYQQRTIGGAQFLHRVLQHVLPKGLRRTRCYGLLNPCARSFASLLRLLVFKAPPALPTPRAQPMRCTCCGAPMRIIARRVPPRHDALAGPPTTCTTATAPPGPTRPNLGAQACSRSHSNATTRRARAKSPGAEPPHGCRMLSAVCAARARLKRAGQARWTVLNMRQPLAVQVAQPE